MGRCHMGQNCAFAHGETELRSTPDFFKTSLCQNFAKGSCIHGSKCRFAHGEAELRPPSFTSKGSGYPGPNGMPGYGFEYSNFEQVDPSMEMANAGYAYQPYSQEALNMHTQIANTGPWMQTVGVEQQQQYYIPYVQQGVPKMNGIPNGAYPQISYIQTTDLNNPSMNGLSNTAYPQVTYAQTTTNTAYAPNPNQQYH